MSVGSPSTDELVEVFQELLDTGYVFPKGVEISKGSKIDDGRKFTESLLKTLDWERFRLEQYARALKLPIVSDEDDYTE